MWRTISATAFLVAFIAGCPGTMEPPAESSESSPPESTEDVLATREGLIAPDPSGLCAFVCVIDGPGGENTTCDSDCDGVNDVDDASPCDPAVPTGSGSVVSSVCDAVFVDDWSISQASLTECAPSGFDEIDLRLFLAFVEAVRQDGEPVVSLWDFNFAVCLDDSDVAGCTSCLDSVVAQVYDVASPAPPVDACPNDPTKFNAGICGCGVPDDDFDADGTPDLCADNCPGIFNPLQEDSDFDGLGDACDVSVPPVLVTELVLIAADGQFLGNVNDNSFDSDSLANSFGTFGSSFNSLSIWNRFGTYGSQFSQLSPWSSFTSTPPCIWENGACTLYVTAGFVSPSIHPNELAILVGRSEEIR